MFKGLYSLQSLPHTVLRVQGQTEIENGLTPMRTTETPKKVFSGKIYVICGQINVLSRRPVDGRPPPPRSSTDGLDGPL